MSIRKSLIIGLAIVVSLALIACILLGPAAAVTGAGGLSAFEDWKVYLPIVIGGGEETTDSYTYTVVDTGQDKCYNNSSEISCPAEDAAFYGQDAQFDGNQPSYTLSADGLTVYDNVTGLTWTQSPDLDGDGDIDINDKLTFTEAQAYADTVLNPQNFGGYNDWRLPSMKELYSLMNFGGTDPSGPGASGAIPFIDTDYFAFGYGDESAGERNIDAQFWSSNVYVGSVFGGQQAAFGLNLADGRIKGYGTSAPGGGSKLNYVYFVRGNTDYGINDFSDNGDGTITDNATGLMWSQNDSGTGMNWEEALAWVEQKNAENYLGYNDWRLPNAKEMQSIVDYSRAPDATGSAAIDPVFNITRITNEGGQLDYPWFWTSTTHARSSGNGDKGVYICFGRATGFMHGSWMDVHGAGAQRSDQKGGDFSGLIYEPNGYYFGHGSQGDATRSYNYVRLVRGGAQSGVVAADTGGSPVGGGQPSGEGPGGSPPTGGQPSAGEGPGGSPPTGGQPSAGEGPSGSPPAEAIQACNGLSEGSTCQFTTPRGSITGTCLPVEAQLACVSEGGPPGGPPPGD